ncbi:MAG TPA: Ig-like domain-containing protein [Solirubrobacter sp.]|nr:Ig-like domain-containing protein [Solirubrobacter sp.]
MRRSIIIGLVCAAVGASTAPASAADGDPYVTACLTRFTTPGCTAALTAQPVAVAPSPDGRQLYASALFGGNSYGLQIFDRDPGTGAVTARGGTGGCFMGSGGAGQCATAGTGNLTDARSVAVSPDGRNVVVSSSGNGGLLLLNFARNTATGALTFVNCVGLTCTGGSEPAGVPTAVAVSPDSANVYLRLGSTLRVYDRDPVTLALTLHAGPTGCLSESATPPAGCAHAAGLTPTDTVLGSFAVSADRVYVPFSLGVSVFTRAADGGLTQSGGTGRCISSNGALDGLPAGQCVDGNDNLAGARTTLISPDGGSVYVGGQYGIIGYARNPATGELTERGCFSDRTGCPGAAGGLSNVWAFAMPPDGTELIASAYGSSSLTFFTRAAGGALSQRIGSRGCFTATGTGGCQPLAGLGSGGQVAVDPSGLFVYAAAVTTGMLATLVRDFAPTCDPVLVSVPFNTAVSVPLTCRDVNGDAFSIERVAGPSAGSLGAVSGGRVVYSPLAGFSGLDSFTYRAVTPTRPGVASGEATVSLSVNGPVAVQAPGGGAPPEPTTPAAPAKRPTLTAGVAHQWTVKGSRLTLTTLKVTQQFPKGWKAKIRCAGKRCPFKAKSLKAGKVRRGAASILGSLSKKQRRFRAGQTVEVWVSAPGFNTKVARFKLIKAKIPQAQPLCVAAGAKKPQRRCD